MCECLSLIGLVNLGNSKYKFSYRNLISDIESTWQVLVGSRQLRIYKLNYFEIEPGVKNGNVTLQP